jgi:hypothetical protein
VPDPSRPATGPDGGDAACWLSEVCADCGALNESPTAPCWRCGTPRDPATAGPDHPTPER